MNAPFPDASILVVDDQPSNVLLLTRLLQRWGYSNVTSTTEPERVLRICQANPPDLVLLDLHMPRLSGLDVLAALRPWMDASPALPVLVITADTTTDACERALAAGAHDFITKPFSSSEVGLRVSNQLATRKAQVDLREYADTLELRVRARTHELERIKLEAIERLALAAEYRDDETQEHAQRVGRTSARLGEALGLSEKSVEVMRRAAPLHDVGKIGVSDKILLKPAPLDFDERAIMNTHTTMGHEILAGSSTELLRVAAQIALTHHERWDGAGYPAGLAGDGIPLVGRIVAVADVFDALTHSRPYKTAWSIPDALGEIKRCGGSQFDPTVVAAFLRLDHEALLAPVSMAPPLRRLPAAAEPLLEAPNGEGHDGAKPTRSLAMTTGLASADRVA